MITVRYFASLRDLFSIDQETIPWQNDLIDIDSLKQHIAKRGGDWQQLVDNKTILSALNQDMANNKSRIKEGDEVAFFPPVTGG